MLLSRTHKNHRLPINPVIDLHKKP